MSKLPISSDVAEVIGDLAENVENSSLLLDKFIFHKKWPVEINSHNQQYKWDDASRWSFIRIAANGPSMLSTEAARMKREASGKNVKPLKVEELIRKADIASRLANCAVHRATKEMSEIQVSHAFGLVSLLKTTRPTSSRIIVGELRTRLAINLSDSLIQNAGICLDRMFGIPYIPGSAFKGVTRHAALKEIAEANDAERSKLLKRFIDVFGVSTTDWDNDLKKYAPELGDPENRRGKVEFMPAYPTNQANIEVDITTVHYPDYYESGMEKDLRKESLRPNPFPVVAAGTKFAFCITLSDASKDAERELLDTATTWLKEALETNGIGAKTGAGYGWFDCSETHTKELNTRLDKNKDDAMRIEFNTKFADWVEKAQTSLNGIDDPQQLRAHIASVESELRDHLAPFTQNDLQPPPLQKIKDVIKSAKNKLPLPSIEETILEKWATQLANADMSSILGSEISGFEKFPDEKKTAIVKILHQNEGPGKDVWSAIKNPTGVSRKVIKTLRRVEQDIRTLSRTMEMGKMP